MKCLRCKINRKYISRTRPYCKECEKTVPMCMQAPLLFADPHRTSATLVARAVLNRPIEEEVC